MLECSVGRRFSCAWWRAEGKSPTPGVVRETRDLYRGRRSADDVALSCVTAECASDLTI